MPIPALLALTAILAIVIGVGVLRSPWLQRRIVFFPEHLDADAPLRFSRPHTDVFFDSGTGSRLHAVRFGGDDDNARRRAILYLHGNAGSLRTWGEVGAELHALLEAGGRDDVVYVVDYGGYGKSRGTLDEPTILQDVVAIYDAVATRHEDVVVFGRSIGTGPATWLASQRRPSLLLLETPYASLVDLAGRLMPVVPTALLAFRFRSDVWMKGVACPVHIFHGTDDEVIPLASARRLIDGGLPVGSSVTVVEGGHHNDLAAFPVYARALRAILIGGDGEAR